MASLVSLVLLLAMVGASDGAWCVCRSDVSASALQKALDYACGAGADCSPIQQGGACYNPNNVRAHCSYAANSYYQRKGQTQQACDFAGAATLSPSDPSANGCTYPASSSAAGTSSSTNSSPTGTNSPGSSTTTGGGGGSTSTINPGTGTGTGTGIGGGLGGLGPSGNTISSTDTNNGGTLLSTKALMASLLVLALSLSVVLKA